MPQPFPEHLAPNVSVNAMEVANKRPHCTLAAFVAISQHSMSEASVASLLITMLDGDPAAAAAIYGTIRNGKLQRDAINAASAEVLSTEDYALLGRILKLLEASSRGRDQLAHSLFSIDERFPDAVVLIDPSQIWRFTLQEKKLNMRGGPEMHEAQAMIDAMRKACTVWTEQDMDQVRLRGVRAFTALTAFSLMLKAKDSTEKAGHKTTVEAALDQK